MSNKPVIILGAGGHAKVVADILKLSSRDVLGFITPSLKFGEEFCGKKVLGNDEVINSYSPEDIELVNGIGSLPRKKLRWQLASRMRQQGYTFASVIHPNTIIAADVDLAEGVQIMAGVVIQAGTKTGIDSIINTGAIIDHDCKIAANCHLAPGVVCSGGVTIGRNTHLGTGTIVIEYRTVGCNCVVAAGTTVFRDIPDNITFIQTK